MAGSAAALYHLSYEDPRIEEQHFFFQIKPGLFAIVKIAINTATTTSSFKVLFSQFTSTSIMIMIMMMMMMMMMIMIMIMIIIMIMIMIMIII